MQGSLRGSALKGCRPRSHGLHQARPDRTYTQSSAVLSSFLSNRRHPFRESWVSFAPCLFRANSRLLLTCFTSEAGLDFRAGYTCRQAPFYISLSKYLNIEQGGVSESRDTEGAASHITTFIPLPERRGILSISI